MSTPGTLEGGGGNQPAANPPPGNPPPGSPPGNAAPPANPPAQQPAWYAKLYDETGKIDKGFVERLPDHLKPHKDLFAKYDSVDALLQGFGNAHSMAVKKALAPLDPSAPPEILAERKAMLDTANGVPKDAKGYGIKRPDNLPEEFWDDGVVEQFGALALKHSLSPSAVKDLLALRVEQTLGEVAKGQTMEAEFFASQDAKFEATMKANRIDLAKANDLATRAAATLNIDPKSPIFRNADVKAALVRVAGLLSEDVLVRGEGAEAKGTYLEQARDIFQNTQNPLYVAYHDLNHPQNKAARDKVNELYRMDGEQKRKRGVV